MTAGSFDEQSLTPSSSTPSFFFLFCFNGPWISERVSGNAMRDEVKETEVLSVCKNRPRERDKSKS